MRFPTPYTWVLLAAGLELGSIVPIISAGILEVFATLAAAATDDS